MPRTALSLVTLSANGVIDINAGTSLAGLVSPGASVAIPTTAVPAAPNIDHLFLYVTNTSGGDKTVTIKAGAGGGAAVGPAFRSGEGDLACVVHTASGGGIIGPLEPARFAQLDGSINIDFQAALTGVIVPYIMPSRW